MLTVVYDCHVVTEHLATMAYQVTIHTAEEKAKLRAEATMLPGDAAYYEPAAWDNGFFGMGGSMSSPRLRIQFARQGNLYGTSQWYDMLAHAVTHCRRKGSEQRGITKEEFMKGLAYRPLAQAAAEQGVTLKQLKAQWNCDWDTCGMSIRIAAANGRTYRDIKGTELRGLMNVLGWG
jgi:hypothetical protein